MNDQRAFPAGRIPANWKEKAEAHIARMNLGKSSEATSAISWQSVGPDNIGGRIRSIAFDPSNSSIMYCGSVSGGIFKSTNSGGSWSPLTDDAQNLVIGSIVVDPSNSNIMYAGTGEGYFNVDFLRGAGVLRTTNGGGRWTLQTNFLQPDAAYSYYYINKLVIRNDNPATLYAALLGGIWKTTNSGTTWSKLTVASKSRFCMDLVMNPSNNNELYAAFGLFSSDGVYKTTNGGTSWSRVSTSFPSTGFGRISLAISPSSPQTVYACLMDSSNYFTHSVRRTTDGGATWSAVTTPFDNDPYVSGTHLGGQGWYNNVIAVHPTSPSTVYTGGINLFKSTNSGSSWSRISSGYGLPYVHADQHAIAFKPGNPAVMYFGNDGGMFMSTDAGSSFTPVNNGLVTAQFYSGAVHPTATTYYGGTQDNGTLVSTVVPSWTVGLSGDGGETWVDNTTPSTVYTEYVYMEVFKSTSSGLNWSAVMNGIPVTSSGWTSDRCSFIAPVAMAPSNSQILVGGTYKVYRTTNGGGLWSGISNDLTGSGNGANQVGQPGATVTALAIAKTSSQTVYAGTSGYGSVHAKIYVTTTAGSSNTWNDITTAILPNREVRRIAIDPSNASRAIAVFSGYETTTPTTPGHVFRTTSMGLAWSNISGNLPDVPANAIAIDPINFTTHSVIGTDLGVFETTNGGSTWTQRNSGMATVSVADLDLRADGYLFAATHGRGMFKSAAPLAVVEERKRGVPSEFSLNQNYPNPFNPTTTISFSIAERSAVRLVLYDVAGREITTLVDEELPAGDFHSEFDGASLASGVYVYRLEARGVAATRQYSYMAMKKMLLVR